MTGGRCSEVVLGLNLLGRVLGWSLLTGGRYSEVVVNTGLTVFEKQVIGVEHYQKKIMNENKYFFSNGQAYFWVG